MDCSPFRYLSFFRVHWHRTGTQLVLGMRRSIEKISPSSSLESSTLSSFLSISSFWLSIAHTESRESANEVKHEIELNRQPDVDTQNLIYLPVTSSSFTTSDGKRGVRRVSEFFLSLEQWLQLELWKMQPELIQNFFSFLMQIALSLILRSLFKHISHNFTSQTERSPLNYTSCEIFSIQKHVNLEQPK